eukprot:TRINITY_DN6666_c0_g1_i3.p1 TRINITY_DN6666_c0_g1~~TRINITY_DN6666_c0_g1_i3.p1  ORF type:complete len:286 (+),score=51.92 TRINITY_DN6666_c0_g1_i3:85-942(+)
MSASAATASPIVEKRIVVTLCGGGNGAHVAVGVLGSKPDSYVVNVLTRKPAEWQRTIKVSTPEGVTLEGHISCISSDPKDVIPTSDIIILCSPVNAYVPILQSVAPYVKQGAYVGTLFAQGGIDMMVRKYCGPEVIAFGFQYIPWISRTREYGKTATLLGRKQFLHLAVAPKDKAEEVRAVMEKLFENKVKLLPTFLCLTLTPSNQIIHPSRYFGVWRDWDGSTPMATLPLLYQDFDQFSADQLVGANNELMAIRDALAERYHLDLSDVESLDERQRYVLWVFVI